MAHSLFAHAGAQRAPRQAAAAAQLRTEVPATATDARQIGSPPGWGLILGVGGMCWVLATVLALLPAAVPSALSLRQYLLAFLAASAAYRAALALRWPEGASGGLAMGLLHGALALAVVALAALVPALGHLLAPLAGAAPAVELRDGGAAGLAGVAP